MLEQTLRTLTNRGLVIEASEETFHDGMAKGTC